MSLIPIIYTSLLIFSGLTVVIIIFSFISYKVKEKNKTYVSTGSSTIALNPSIQSYAAPSLKQAKRMPPPVFASNESAKMKQNNIRNDAQTMTRTVYRREQPSPNSNKFENSDRYNNFNELQRKSAPPDRRFEIYRTFERRPSGNSDYSENYRQTYNKPQSYLNYYSDDSSVYFPPNTRS